jgi:RNA polymerase sigma factor (TIGR02999 family)
MEITELLKEWSAGESDALEKLMPLVMDELRKVAGYHFKRESAGHTLQPTALVNEVFLQLHRQHKINLENRAQFLAFSAKLMRRVLVDHARGRNSLKRGGDAYIIPLEEIAVSVESRDVDVLALDETLNDLSRMDPEGSRVVELRFFGGLTYEEIAELEGISVSGVRRRWTVAKLWLFRELSRR